MAINALTKLAAQVSDIPLKNLDGSPMLDEANNPASATMFGPASKIWQVANSLRNRKRLKRVREANGKIEASADDSEDTSEFLCTVVNKFNGFEIPGEADQVRAILSHPELGYIRDQLNDAAGNWENFTSAPSPSFASTPSNLPG